MWFVIVRAVLQIAHEFIVSLYTADPYYYYTTIAKPRFGLEWK